MAWRGERMSRRGGDGGERYKNTARRRRGRRRRRGGRNGRKGKEARKEGGTRVRNGSSAGGCARVGASETRERDRWCPLLSLGVLRFYRASAVPGQDVSASARHHQPRGQPAKAWRSVRLRSAAGAGVVRPLFRPFLGFSVPWPYCGGPDGQLGWPVQRTESARDCSRRHMCHPPLPATWAAVLKRGAAHSRTGSFCLFFPDTCTFVKTSTTRELTVPKQAPSPVWTREPVNHACCVVIQ